jgi:hypothetical protein
LSKRTTPQDVGPIIELEVDRWLSSPDNELLNLAQQGAYMNLLCHQVKQPNGTLPSDENELAAMSKLRAAWSIEGPPILKRCFVPVRVDGEQRWVNRKLYKQWRASRRSRHALEAIATIIDGSDVEQPRTSNPELPASTHELPYSSVAPEETSVPSGTFVGSRSLDPLKEKTGTKEKIPPNRTFSATLENSAALEVSPSQLSMLDGRASVVRPHRMEQLLLNEQTGPLIVARFRAQAREVFLYWSKRAGVKVYSKQVGFAIARRIIARLLEGFSSDELQRCVDVAMRDRNYIEHGYYKQPDVIWRNADRVASLLLRGMSPSKASETKATWERRSREEVAQEMEAALRKAQDQALGAELFKSKG